MYKLVLYYYYYFKLIFIINDLCTLSVGSLTVANKYSIIIIIPISTAVNDLGKPHREHNDRTWNWSMFFGGKLKARPTIENITDD